MEGKLDKIVERIVSECKLKLDRPLIKDLQNLYEHRNRIVHERAVEEEVRLEQVQNSFGLLLYLLYVLGQAAAANQVPYWDEFDFLDDFEKQLRKN